MHVILKVCDYELVTPRYAHRPQWYDKLACVKSFIHAAKNAESMISGITWIHDGPPGPVLELIKLQHVIKTSGLGVHGAIIKSNEIANKVDDDLCFIDDDYLHLPTSMLTVVHALPRFGLVSGYDCPDRYVRDDDIDYPVRVTWDPASQRHWRTAESACFTYAITKELWRKNPWLHFEVNDREAFRKFHRLGVPLWTPIPGVYTHCNDMSRGSFVSPGVDWENVSNAYMTMAI